MAKQIKKNNGRPKKLKDIDFELVEKYASLGLTDIEISDLLGICRATLSNYKVQDTKFLDTLKSGKLKADMKVVNSLYTKATNGDTTAMIFWLKNRRTKQWRDKQVVEHEGLVEVTLVDDIKA